MIIRYLDGSRPLHKMILDQWIARRHEEGRGVIMTTTRLSDITQPRVRDGRINLPKVWAQGIEAIRLLDPQPQEVTSHDEVAAYPFWNNKIIPVATSK